MYFVNGKRTKISTKTSDRGEAEKFLKHFDPDEVQEKPKRETSIDMISSRNIDQFISSIMPYSKSAASLYYRTLKPAFNKAYENIYLKYWRIFKVKIHFYACNLPSL